MSKKPLLLVAEILWGSWEVEMERLKRGVPKEGEPSTIL